MKSLINVEQTMEKKNNPGVILFGFIIGGIIGASLALLIRSSIEKLPGKKTSAKFKDLLDDTGQIFDTGSETADQSFKGGRKKATDVPENSEESTTK